MAVYVKWAAIRRSSKRIGAVLGKGVRRKGDCGIRYYAGIPYGCGRRMQQPSCGLKGNLMLIIHSDLVIDLFTLARLWQENVIIIIDVVFLDK